MAESRSKDVSFLVYRNGYAFVQASNQGAAIQWITNEI